MHFFIRSTMLIACLHIVGRLFAQAPPVAVDAAGALQNVLVDVVERCEKSVVAVARVRREQPGDTFRFDFRPDPFGRRLMPLTPLQPTDPDFIPNQYGAGVVVDPLGLILTTYDLLDDESDYYITTPDRKTYQAAIKAADPRSNLAVLHIEAAGLPPIVLGDGAALKKGQFVISLGNPHAIARDGQSSAAWGIVANLGRKAPAAPSEADPTARTTLHHYGTLIQTDVKMHLGAGGGPLLNLQGEMVGLCILPATESGYGSAGGFAIPVDDTFRRALETLKAGREVEYGFLGIQPQNLQTREILSGIHGVRVGEIVPGTPAARSGLKPGDIITDVNDTALHDADGFVLHVGKLPADAVARLRLLRGGNPSVVEVSLTKYAVEGKKIVTVADPAWRGLRVDYPSAVVDETGRPRAGTSLPDRAVIVIEAAENSPARAAGLRPGALITRVDGEPVRTPKEFLAAVSKNSGPVKLDLAGDDTIRECTVEP